MKVDTKNLVSITEANQNFSKVARLVEENGTVVILKNNEPRYILIDYNLINAQTYADTEVEEVEEIAKILMAKYARAFEELAKCSV